MSGDSNGGGTGRAHSHEGSGHSAGIWSRLGHAIQDPWDWVAATAGGAAGCVVTLLTHFTDVGTCTAAGALAAVSGRQAIVAASLKGKLIDRAKARMRSIEAWQPEMEQAEARTD